MKAHPEPLARLLLDRDYNALVRGNERRGDAVRAMAADDFAQEFLNDRGWAAYSLALELLGKHTSGGGSTRIDGRDVSLFAGGINAEPFRLEYGRVDAAPGTPPAATWATPPQSSTRSRSATNCGAAWGCTRRPS